MKTSVCDRLAEIGQNSARVVFCEGDGLAVLSAVTGMPRTVVFADPPYTAGGRRGGRRLYNHAQVDPRAAASCDFVLTYDPAPEIVALIDEYSFTACRVTAITAYHSWAPELVITRQPVFGDS